MMIIKQSVLLQASEIDEEGGVGPGGEDEFDELDDDEGEEGEDDLDGEEEVNHGYR